MKEQQGVATSTLVVAIDTSTDMLACAVAQWTPVEASDGVPAHAQVEVLAHADHLCRRRANVELVGTIEEALEQAFFAAREG